ncbi:hypothetical protein GLOIN_2v229933 [Rhizophagus clarus]|uniref:Uncharacterized protein n=1 Tax=Rhizophagus clarus TaxID=94130 RepID=A0A8H3L4F1_9GLOM|nr:hypothetical protein GLOIN_2v229933 [Rhizophagus clarus]
MSSELEVLITELEAKKTDERARLEALRRSFAELEARILKSEQNQAERETKKNRKFQTSWYYETDAEPMQFDIFGRHQALIRSRKAAIFDYNQ